MKEYDHIFRQLDHPLSLDQIKTVADYAKYQFEHSYVIYTKFLLSYNFKLKRYREWFDNAGYDSSQIYINITGKNGIPRHTDLAVGTDTYIRTAVFMFPIFPYENNFEHFTPTTFFIENDKQVDFSYKGGRGGLFNTVHEHCVLPGGSDFRIMLNIETKDLNTHLPVPYEKIVEKL